MQDNTKIRVWGIFRDEIRDLIQMNKVLISQPDESHDQSHKNHSRKDFERSIHILPNSNNLKT